MKHSKTAAEFVTIAILASMSALNYIIFVFPNHFAPAGVDGICTMIQDVFQINMGWLSLAANIPLLIAVFLKLNRDFAVRSTIYILAFSFSMIVLRQLDLTPYLYISQDGAGMVFAPIAAGTIRGLLYALTLNVNATSGGADLVAALIKNKHPHLELMNVLFGINLCISLSSYFVYGRQYEPVISSILYSFILTSVCNHITQESGKKIRYEVITNQYQDVCREILSRYNTTSTIVDAHGAFANTDNKVVICVANRKIAPYIEDLLNSFSNTVIFKSEVDNRLAGVSYK